MFSLRSRSAGGTHAPSGDAQAALSAPLLLVPISASSAPLPQATSISARSAAAQPETVDSHGQSSSRHTLPASSPFDPLDKLIPEASRRLNDINFDDEDDEDDEDGHDEDDEDDEEDEGVPSGPDSSGLTFLQAHDSLNSGSTFDSARLLSTSEAATPPSDETSSSELSPRLDRHSSVPVLAPSLPSSVNDTRLDRRSSSFAPPSLPMTVVTDGEPDAPLARVLGTQPAVPSSEGNLSSTTDSSFDFPAFTLSALPSWLSGPVSHLSEHFCGQKELSVIKGLVALEQKWGSVRDNIKVRCMF